METHTATALANAFTPIASVWSTLSGPLYYFGIYVGIGVLTGIIIRLLAGSGESPPVTPFLILASPLLWPLVWAFCVAVVVMIVGDELRSLKRVRAMRRAAQTPTPDVPKSQSRGQ